MALIVDLGERSYPIHVQRDLSAQLQAAVLGFLDRGRKVAVVADENVVRAQSCYLGDVFGAAPLLVLPAGETSKSFAHVAQVCEFLARERLDRGAVLFAFGGGVIGDLAGFAAACYQRGIDFVQVPTTLLAMVDSSVGGKTGVNLGAGKNLAGAFWQPRAVYADLALLDTLPMREFSAGMAEVIKHGMLADAELFERLEKLPPLGSRSRELPEIVERNCAIKAGIVGRDERETAASGGRALLNLGHTFAHALENVAGYGTYLHGEAVGLGLVMAARLSQELGLIASHSVDRVAALVRRYQLPMRLRAPLRVLQLEDVMLRDKKVRAGRLRFVVLNRIGEAMTQEGVDVNTIRALWREVGAV